MKNFINIIVSENDKKLRIDSFIHNKEKSLSRTRIKNLILKNKLKLNNKIITDPSKIVRLGDKVILEIPEPEETSLKPYNYKLDIVFEDKDGWKCYNGKEHKDFHNCDCFASVNEPYIFSIEGCQTQAQRVLSRCIAYQHLQNKYWVA